jgi:hypothetical protein
MPDITTVCADAATLKNDENKTRRRTAPRQTPPKKKYRCSTTNPWQNKLVQTQPMDIDYNPSDPAERY